MTLGIDYNSLTQDYIYQKQRQYGSYSSPAAGNSPTFASVPKMQGYAVSPTTGNTCTDGKDDGSIGVGGVIKSIATGAGKSLLNCALGCFTDKDGHFSLKKTLFSAGIAALCIAVPAVGAVACGIGVVAGATGVANGLINAHNATTDADKKDALENFGDGAFTAITSALGLKASVGAVKATSAAGKLTALEEAAKAGKKVTLLQRLGALGQDMVSSSVNNLKNIVNGFKIFRLNNKYKNLNFDPKYAKAEDIAGKIQSATDSLKSLKGKMSPKNALKSVGNFIKEIPEQIKGIKLTDIKTKILKTPAARFEALKSTLSPKAQGVLEAIKKAGGVSNEFMSSLVKDFGYEGVMEALEAFAGARMLDETI